MSQSFYPPLKIKDSCEVRVGYNLEVAIRKLKKRLEKSRIFVELKDRRVGISKAGRKRIKQKWRQKKAL